MSHSTSHSTPDDLAREERPAVRSALKATLVRRLAEEATNPRFGATPQHLASPGRLHSAART
jgi:hypothetical protein